MSAVATAIVGGALIGGVASSGAASTQAGASGYAADLQNQQFNKIQENQKPWIEAGTNALSQMTQGTQPGGEFATPKPFSFTAQDFAANQDPGYAFRLQQGLKSLDASAAARGGLLSGSALKGITRYGQDYGSQEYQNSYNRALTGYNTNLNASNTGFNRLASIAGLGQTANSQVNSAGQTAATNIGNAAMAGANASAAGQVGTANAINNGISQGLSMYQQGNTMNMMDKWMNQRYPSSSAIPSNADYANNGWIG